MFRNILVAIDGSAHATLALEHAIDLAQQAHARLTVMVSVPDPSGWLLAGGAYGGAIDLEALAQETSREYNDLLERAVEKVPSDLPVAKILAHGPPAERILEQLEAGRHDLVVMGSRGRGDVRALLLGSVSHHVLNATRRAVLIVHADESPDR